MLEPQPLVRPFAPVPTLVRLALLLIGVSWPTGVWGQTIQITSLPTYGSAGALQGVAAGVDPATHRVAAFIHVEGSGWWTKPTTQTPTVAINPNGTFSVNVVTGGLDHLATIFGVALVPDTANVPQVLGAVGMPQSQNFLAIDTAERYGPTLQFAGRTWAVKEAPLAVDPGQNTFASGPSDVWVDGQGLHLTCRFQGGKWWSTEVILLGAPLGHGTYRFTTRTDIQALDADVTLGAFLWDSYGDAAAPFHPNREFDSEDSRWGSPADPTTSQFVNQPYWVGGNLLRYTVPQLVAPHTLTRFVEWLPDQIRFVAAEGAPDLCSIPPSSKLVEWTYSHDPSQSHYVPTPGRARFRFNLWLNDAVPHAPLNGQSAEVVISDFSFGCAPLCIGVSYCTAGTSASGCRPAVGAAGTASATAASGFTLSASGIEGNKVGLFYFGSNGRQANPWGNGTSYQCVVPPVKRAGLLAKNGTSGLCDGAFAQDLNSLWCPGCPSPAKNPGAGALVQAQFWYRDPLNTSNQTTSLSDAIEFTIGP